VIDARLKRPQGKAMHMRYHRSIEILSLLILSLLLAGCGSGGASPSAQDDANGDGRAGEDEPSAGRVAVVDVQQLAEATGIESQVARLMQRVEKQREQQLQQYQGSLQKKIKNFASQFGESPSKQQQQQLRQQRVQAIQNLRQAKERLQQSVQQAREKVIEDFRRQIRPIANEVATERGMGVVLAKTNHVIAARPSADITDALTNEVNQLMKAGRFNWQPQTALPETSGQGSADQGGGSTTGDVGGSNNPANAGDVGNPANADNPAKGGGNKTKPAATNEDPSAGGS
jgi:Skp family chaperone for outer membrane proteins